MRILKIVSTSCVFLLAISCVKTLEVENLNDPDTKRVVVTPGDVESLISGAFLTYWVATEEWYGPMATSAMADEITMSWGNAAVKDLSSEPRVEYPNTTTYRYHRFLEVPWYDLYKAVSSVNDGLREILVADPPVLIGDNGKDNPRVQAFGRLVQGLSYAFLAAFFDRAFIVDETVDMEAVALDPSLLTLSPHQDVMAAAIGFLKECIDISEKNDFDIPSNWINKVPLSNDQLARLAHSYIARYTAAVARTPAEREAVDWASVKTHVNAGILDGEDFAPYGDGYVAWISDYRWAIGLHQWTRADYKTIGLADTTGVGEGGYIDWLKLPVANREEFLLYTADRRITGSTADPKSEGTDFYYAGPSVFRRDRGTYHFSMYDTRRWVEYSKTEDLPMTTLTKAEMDLLLAEAEYRLGNKAEAAALVNKYHVDRGQLPALTGSETGDEATGEPSFFDWLMYNKKIEVFATGGGLAYFDRRGWPADNVIKKYDSSGQTTGLVTDTPVQFPVPAKEIEIVFATPDSVYTFGGGGPWGAPKLAPKAHPARE